MKSKSHAALLCSNSLKKTNENLLVKYLENEFFISEFLYLDTLKKKLNSIDEEWSLSKENVLLIFQRLKISTLFIAGNILTKDEKLLIANVCYDLTIEILIVPLPEKVDHNSYNSFLIQSCSIEWLLCEQHSYPLQTFEIEKIENKNLLVTGGAGSIGSKLVQLLVNCNPSSILIVDNSEKDLFELELLLKNTNKISTIEYRNLNICDTHAIENILKEKKIDTIYHTAAIKHVTYAEEHILETIKVNLLATLSMAQLAVKYQVGSFIFISTDKAVMPVGIMGATKRAAEVYLKVLQHNSKSSTQFITVRFGNVVGSKGSVIPVFKEQIVKNNKVTVTHPDMTRYFMTVDVACLLVLRAAMLGKPGDILVFSMGSPLHIYELAKYMIWFLKGKNDVDLDIEITGIRTGEKLHEMLYKPSDILVPTAIESVVSVKENLPKYESISDLCNKLTKATTKGESQKSIQLLKEIIPEFKHHYLVD